MEINMSYVNTNFNNIKFELESNNIKNYLISSDIIDYQNLNIIEKTNQIIKTLTSSIDKIKNIYVWVRDNIPHSKDINSDIVTCKASDVLNKGTGICYAKSHLLAAMLRLIKIPTGFCYQLLKKDPPFSGFVLHGLNAIYIKNKNKWILVDSRGNTGIINAQFNIDSYQLAFEMDENAGEFIYNKIFFKPVDKVIIILNKYNNRNEMWKYLPDSI